MKIKSIIIIGLASLFLSVCAPTKRATKKIDKAVSLTSPDYVIGYVVDRYNVKGRTADTIYTYKSDTVSLTHVINLRDTVQLRDTIVTQNERLKLSIIRLRDTIKIKGECISETVRVKVVEKYDGSVKVYNKTEQQEKSRKFFWLIVFVNMLIALIVILVLYYINNRKNNI